MYYRDLGPFKWFNRVPLSDVLTVGWLSLEHQFPTGEPRPDLVLTLEALLSSHRANLARGYHSCEFCPPRCKMLKAAGREIPVPQPLLFELSDRTIVLGSAEIWVPSPDRKTVYAAPDMIFHYVSEHGYMPPQEFVAAALNANQINDWNAEEECVRRLATAYQ